MRLNLVFEIVALVLFLLAALLVLVVDTADAELVMGLALLGLASHSAGHLPV